MEFDGLDRRDALHAKPPHARPLGQLLKLHAFRRLSSDEGSHLERIIESTMDARDYAALDPLIKVGQTSFVLRQKAEPLPSILTIKEAAAALGVSQPTLRRWDEAGKFRARRHPINGYRLYERDKVLAMRKKIFGKAA